jgi:hypothetical protein
MPTHIFWSFRRTRPEDRKPALGRTSSLRTVSLCKEANHSDEHSVGICRTMTQLGRIESVGVSNWLRSRTSEILHVT